MSAAPSTGSLELANSSNIELVDVCKSYGGPNIVDHASFKVKRGELLTLLGPSGSGKTTILLMVAGFERPSSGDILVNGASIIDVPPQRRNLGIVFQSYSLFPHMSVLDNVEFPLRMRRLRRADGRAKGLEILERVGLLQFAARRPRQLSGGQQQRVALARALVFEPEALLLDEPLGALDKKLRDSLQLEIKAIQRSFGVSVLYVTHDQEEAMTMSDRIAIICDGRIVQIGPPRELYIHPVNTFVANFLGETNLLPCTILAADPELSRVRFRDGTEGVVRSRIDAQRSEKSQVVSIRPERIQVLKTEERPANAVVGTVVDKSFLGPVVRYSVQALGQQLVVRLPELDGRASFGIGGSIKLGWSAEDAQLLGSS